MAMILGSIGSEASNYVVKVFCLWHTFPFFLNGLDPQSLYVQYDGIDTHQSLQA